jgi:hypothetical protein
VVNQRDTGFVTGSRTAGPRSRVRVPARFAAILVAVALLAPAAVVTPAPTARAAEPSKVPPAAKELRPSRGTARGPRLRGATPTEVETAGLRKGTGACEGLYEDPAAKAAWEASPAADRGLPPCVAAPDFVAEPTASAAIVTGQGGDLVAPPVQCFATGPFVKVFYVYRSGSTNRLSSWRPTIVRAIAAADLHFDRAAEAVGGATRHVRWLMDASCELSITAVAVTSSHVTDTSPFTILGDLVAKGVLASSEKALAFTDDGGSSCNGLAGIATAATDDSPGSTNVANSGRSLARVFGWCTADPDMRSVDLGSIAAHELMHTLGAVQPTAPHATPNGHCTDEDDAMCYADGGGAMQDVCPAELLLGAFDCNKDDYFNPAPPAGTYLATHWNTANNVFLARADATAASPMAPQVAITSPSAGAEAAGDVTVEIGATADGGTSIARVDIYVNGVLKASPASAPYRVTLPTTQDPDTGQAPPNGPMTIDAVAWDAAGRWAFAPRVSVIVANPKVRLTAPRDGALVGGPVAWSAEPVASSGRSVVKVELLADGEVVATDATAPYGGSWDSSASDWVTTSLVARVTDSAGVVAMSPGRDIGLERISAGALAPQSAPAGAPVRLAARFYAWPRHSGVDRVDFYVTPQGSVPVLVGSASGPTYATWWTPPAEGVYSVVAHAVGEVAPAVDSAPTWFEIATPLAGASLGITSPTDGASLGGSSALLSAVLTLPADWAATGVEFQVDGWEDALPAALVGGAWQASWGLGAVVPGSHMVTAVAYVERAATGETRAIGAPGIVVLRPGPAISLTAPAPGAIVGGDLTVSAAWTALPSDPVTGVELCAGVSRCSWVDVASGMSSATQTLGAGDLPAVGTAQIWASAYTAAGRAVSDPVDVTIAAEQLAITSPAQDARVGGRIRLAATALAVGGARVERVVFRIDGRPVASADEVGWDGPYEAEWNTSLEAAGAHELSASAQLSDGRTLETAGLAITVVQPGLLVNPIAGIGALAEVRLTSSATVRWSATPAAAPITSYDVRYRRASWNGRLGGYVAWKTATTATSASVSIPVGYTYCFSVRAHDALPSVSAWSAEGCTTRGLDDRSLARSGSWTSGTGTSYYLGTYRRSYTNGAKLTRTGVVARSVFIVATTCPTCGTVRVYLGPELLSTVRLVTRTTRNRQVIPIAWFCTERTGTLTIKVVSSHRKVVIDGVAFGK